MRILWMSGVFPLIFVVVVVVVCLFVFSEVRFSCNQVSGTAEVSIMSDDVVVVTRQRKRERQWITDTMTMTDDSQNDITIVFSFNLFISLIDSVFFLLESDGRDDDHEVSDVSDPVQQIRCDAGHAVGGEFTGREYVDHE